MCWLGWVSVIFVISLLNGYSFCDSGSVVYCMGTVSVLHDQLCIAWVLFLWCMISCVLHGYCFCDSWSVVYCMGTVSVIHDQLCILLGLCFYAIYDLLCIALVDFFCESRSVVNYIFLVSLCFLVNFVMHVFSIWVIHVQLWLHSFQMPFFPIAL